MICKCCKKTFYYGERSDGLPNGVGFVLDDGERIDVCTDCIQDTTKYTGFLQNLTEYLKKNLPEEKHVSVYLDQGDTDIRK